MTDRLFADCCYGTDHEHAERDPCPTDALDRLAREIRHCLTYRLEGFSNGAAYPPSSPANKTNGYTAAKVADWRLRQWLALVETAQGMSAVGENSRSEVEGEARQPGPARDAPKSKDLSRNAVAPMGGE
jgi:hypothetical protein